MFEKHTITARLLTPVDFKEVSQQIEYRKDPLLGRWCRVNVNRAKRVKQAGSEQEYPDLIKNSAKNCYFCPENLERDTPKFPAEIAPEGRIRIGETWVFPNLFPFSQYHAVATICEKHYLTLREFTPQQISNTLQASIEYFKRVYKKDKKAKFMTFSWNYLPPSGASIVHPHVQLMADQKATYLTALYQKASEDYYKKNKENYWLKLIKEEEKSRVRFIQRTGSIAWFTSFVPLGNHEINAVFEDTSALTDLTSSQISELSKGIKNLLMGYASLGIQSFNLTAYSAPVDRKREDFLLNVKAISRPAPQKYYTSDAGFMEILHQERVLEAFPEEVARKMRRFF